MKSIETINQKVSKLESFNITDLDVSKEDIEQYANEEQSYVFGLSIARLNMLFNRAIMKGDLRTALAVQIEISELYGLHNQGIERDNTINITFTHGEERML